MAFDLSSLQNLGLAEVTLWLLSFAVVYGILGQADVPKSKASRMIIAIVIAFFVVLSAPTALINVFSRLASNLIIVLIGIIVLVVFVEVAGVKARKEVEILDKEGKGTRKMTEIEVKIFEKYGYIFLIGFLIIAALVFVNSGGLAALGWNFALSPASTTTVIFLAVIILAILWMVMERKQ